MLQGKEPPGAERVFDQDADDDAYVIDDGADEESEDAWALTGRD
jgi:hypothetical protein